MNDIDLIRITPRQILNKENLLSRISFIYWIFWYLTFCWIHGLNGNLDNHYASDFSAMFYVSWNRPDFSIYFSKNSKFLAKRIYSVDSFFICILGISFFVYFCIVLIINNFFNFVYYFIAWWFNFHSPSVFLFAVAATCSWMFFLIPKSIMLLLLAVKVSMCLGRTW